MNKFTFDERWDQIAGKLKQRYGQLADDDLTFAEGKGEELLGRLRQTLGISEKDLDSVLGELHAGASGSVEKLRGKATELAGEVREKTAAAASELKTHAGEAYQQARERAWTLRDDGEEYVRQNPREALIGALFAGFVVGLIIHR